MKLSVACLLLWCIGQLCYAVPQTIPNVIWTYWPDVSNIPQIVARLYRNWETMNPDYKLRIVSRNTMSKYIPASAYPWNFNQLSASKQSDWTRLYLLSQHGGFYLDPSVILTRPLDWIQDLQESQKAQGVMFYMGSLTKSSEYPAIRKWFMATRPGDMFMTAWFRLFHDALQTYGENDGAYLEALKDDFDPKEYENFINSQPTMTLNGNLRLVDAVAGFLMQTAKPNYIWLRAEDGPESLGALSNFRTLETAQKIVHPMTCAIPAIIRIDSEVRWWVSELASRGEARDPRSIFNRYLA